MKTDLSQERVKELYDYDAENGLMIRKFKNGKRKVCGDKPGYHHGRGMLSIDGRYYYTHRVIWLWHHGYMPEFIDHIDRNPMNNRIENLRPATRLENNHNKGTQRNNSSGYPGVSWDKQREKYRVRIMNENKHIHIGYFNTTEEAFLNYMLAKIQYHPSSPDAQEYLRELTLAG